MHSPYYEGTKEIFPLTRLDIDKDTYCDVSISQFWEPIFRSDCSCGVEKSRSYRRKWGFSKEYSVNIETELGFTLDFGLASLSPKIGASINKTITSTLEEESEDVVKFKAPKCGKHEIAIYQLMSRWHIEPYKVKKKFLRKTIHTKLNPLDFDIGESEWTDSNNVYHTVPSCRCIEESQYDGNVTLVINSGIINLPCKILEGRLVIYGIDGKSFLKGDILKLDELPIDILRSLHSNSQAKILTHGEKLPVLDIVELVPKLNDVLLTIKEILSNYFAQDYNEVGSVFESVIIIGLQHITSPLEILKTSIVDNEEAIKKLKLSLNKIKNGDLSDVSQQFNSFYNFFNDSTFQQIENLIKERYGDEVKNQLQKLCRELYNILNKFYESCKEQIIDFLKKSADLVCRLLEADNIQEANLMIREFTVTSEGQLSELNKMASSLLSHEANKQSAKVEPWEKLLTDLLSSFIKSEKPVKESQTHEFTDFRLKFDSGEDDEEEIERVNHQLVRELNELPNIKSINLVKEHKVPMAVKGEGVVLEILVTLLASVGVITSLINFLQSFTKLNNKRNIEIITKNGHSVKLNAISPDKLKEFVESVIHENKGDKND